MLIWFCSLVEYPIFGLEADSGVDIPSKADVKVLIMEPVEAHILTWTWYSKQSCHGCFSRPGA